MKTIIIKVSKNTLELYVEMMQKSIGDQCIIWKEVDGQMCLTLPDIGVILGEEKI